MLSRKTLILTGAVAVLSSTCVFGATKSTHGVPGVAAVVNGDKITVQEVRDAMFKWYAPQGVEEYMITRLVNAEAKKANVVVTDAQVKAKIAEIEKRAAGSGMSFADFLKRQGKTMDYVTAMIRMDMQANGILMKTYKVDPKDIENYRKASQIVVTIGQKLGSPDAKDAEKILAESDKAAKEKATKILDEIKAGLPFEEAVKKYSEDYATKSKGGNMGWVTLNVVGPTLEASIFGLKNVGDVSDVVKSPLGYHILKLTGLGKNAKGADRQDIISRIRESKINTREWMMGLRRDAKVQSIYAVNPGPQVNRSRSSLTPLKPTAGPRPNAPARVMTPPPPPPPPPPPAPSGAAAPRPLPIMQDKLAPAAPNGDQGKSAQPSADQTAPQTTTSAPTAAPSSGK